MAGKSLKIKLLELLEKDRNANFSGQELANHFGVTRAAVWKAIQALRNDGYQIEGVQNLGYRLNPETDMISPGIISEYLTQEAKDFYHIECFDTVTSTNTLLKEQAATAATGSVLVAEMQTAGRGRMGRSFFSPKGSGIYMSILLRPDVPAAKAVQITAAAAVAGAKGFESAFPVKNIQIKWVNDLFLKDFKIAGILTEGMLSMETGNLDYAIVGIGFNLTQPEDGWPDDIQGVAGGVALGLPDGKVGRDARAKTVAGFLNAFLPYYQELLQNTADTSFYHEYLKRQLVIGKDIEVLKGNAVPREARAIGLDQEFRLLVRYKDDSSEEALSSGEVRIKPKKKASQ